jgi:hypothetical protein
MKDGKIILGLLLLLVSCSSQPREEARSNPIELLRRLVVPPDSAGGCESPVTDTYSATVTCDLTVSGTEDAYRRWLHSRLSERFLIREISGGRLLMTRYADGETQEVKIVMNSVPDSRTRIQITFRVYAD